MIPFVEPPVLRIGSTLIPAFWILVAVGCVVGFELAIRRAGSTGIERSTAAKLTLWSLASGFMGSHLVAEFAYHYPKEAWKDPVLLLWPWGSMSSFGGIAGGLLGTVLASRSQKMGRQELLRFADALAYSFPFGFAFGRLGCALVHDHVGIATDHWLAVRFPEGPRLDLGLLEFLAMPWLCVWFKWLSRQPRPPGFFLGLFLGLYGALRVGLDALRVGEPRWWGWTPGQYGAVAAVVAGILLLGSLLQRQPSPDGIESR